VFVIDGVGRGEAVGAAKKFREGLDLDVGDGTYVASDIGPVLSRSAVGKVVAHFMESPGVGIGICALDMGWLVCKFDSVAVRVESLFQESSFAAITACIYSGAVRLVVK
jgi:hypothetical protein